MSNTKHTPGEWRVEKQNYHHVTNGLVTIADVSPHNKEGEVNAKLIAAAPELLEALRQLSSQISKMDYDEYAIPALGLAYDAIKKATE